MHTWEGDVNYEIKYKALTDEVCVEVYRNGVCICSFTHLGESPAEILKIAIAHAKEVGL